MTRLATVHTASCAFHLLQMAGRQRSMRFDIDGPKPNLTQFCQSLLFFHFGLKGCARAWPPYRGAHVSDLTQHKCLNVAKSTIEQHCSLQELES